MTSDDDGTLQAIESFYKIHRTNWTEAYSNTCETKPSFQLRIKYAIELAKNSSARLVLDAGCGTGELIAELARSGIPCDGIDASKEMLAAQMEHRLSHSWQANFLASSFLVCARKLRPDPQS